LGLDLKTGLLINLSDVARKYFGLIGERAERIQSTCKLNPYRLDEKLSVNNRNVVKYSAIHSMLESEIWETIESNKIPKHPCYALGVSRASCAICIFSSNKEIAIAYNHAPEIVKKYIQAEEKISHSFRYKGATKSNAEQRQSVRQILESQGIEIK
jgi:3'-phosphoadenosine 5'-phosphosulfate sulfotransferase (PAPS reductase)/FAD synthetase